MQESWIKHTHKKITTNNSHRDVHHAVHDDDHHAF